VDAKKVWGCGTSSADSIINTGLQRRCRFDSVAGIGTIVEVRLPVALIVADSPERDRAII